MSSNMTEEMTFEEAVEIYIENAQAKMEEIGCVGSVSQLGTNESYLKGGIWYLRNINGHLARVGTKSKRVLPEAFASRDPNDEPATDDDLLSDRISELESLLKVKSQESNEAWIHEAAGLAENIRKLNNAAHMK